MWKIDLRLQFASGDTSSYVRSCLMYIVPSSKNLNRRNQQASDCDASIMYLTEYSSVWLLSQRMQTLLVCDLVIWIKE